MSLHDSPKIVSAIRRSKGFDVPQMKNYSARPQTSKQIHKEVIPSKRPSTAIGLNYIDEGNPLALAVLEENLKRIHEVRLNEDNAHELYNFSCVVSNRIPAKTLDSIASANKEYKDQVEKSKLPQVDFNFHTALINAHTKDFHKYITNYNTQSERQMRRKERSFISESKAGVEEEFLLK